MCSVATALTQAICSECKNQLAWPNSSWRATRSKPCSEASRQSWQRTANPRARVDPAMVSEKEQPTRLRCSSMANLSREKTITHSFKDTASGKFNLAHVSGMPNLAGFFPEPDFGVQGAPLDAGQTIGPSIFPQVDSGLDGGLQVPGGEHPQAHLLEAPGPAVDDTFVIQPHFKLTTSTTKPTRSVTSPITGRRSRSSDTWDFK